MGCKPSRPALAIVAQIQKELEERDNNRQLDTAQTPYDIRKIRNELFSRDSIVAVVPSSETASTQEDSVGGFSDPSNAAIVFLPEDEIPQKPQRKINYHYPAALYHKLKTVHHFVPSSDGRQECHRKLRHVSSGESDDFSGMSELGGDLDYMNMYEGDLSPFEALVDTMALSLEPSSDDMFGALVDQLSEVEDEKYYFDSDGEGTAATATMPATVCTSMACRKPKRSHNKRHSAPPPPPTMLQQQMSYELAADIKNMALAADMSDRSQSMLHIPMQNKQDVEDFVASCVKKKAIKFIRSDSVVPARRDSMSVCSGW